MATGEQPGLPTSPTGDPRLSVRRVRELIDGLPDDAEFGPAWGPGETPGDADPAVTVLGFRHGTDCGGRPMVEILVGLRYLDELDEEEDDKALDLSQEWRENDGKHAQNLGD